MLNEGAYAQQHAIPTLLRNPVSGMMSSVPDKINGGHEVRSFPYPDVMHPLMHVPLRPVLPPMQPHDELYAAPPQSLLQSYSRQLPSSMAGRSIPDELTSDE